MTTQIKYHALEHNKTRIGNSQALEKSLPEKLLLEISGFKGRNSLSRELKCIGLVIKECCPRCLKAHLIKKAKDLNMEKQAEVYIKSLNCEIGHNGYYKDGEELLSL